MFCLPKKLCNKSEMFPLFLHTCRYNISRFNIVMDITYEMFILVFNWSFLLVLVLKTSNSVFYTAVRPGRWCLHRNTLFHLVSCSWQAAIRSVLDVGVDNRRAIWRTQSCFLSSVWWGGVFPCWIRKDWHAGLSAGIRWLYHHPSLLYADEH